MGSDLYFGDQSHFLTGSLVPLGTDNGQLGPSRQPAGVLGGGGAQRLAGGEGGPQDSCPLPPNPAQSLTGDPQMAWFLFLTLSPHTCTWPGRDTQEAGQASQMVNSCWCQVPGRTPGHTSSPLVLVAAGAKRRLLLSPFCGWGRWGSAACPGHSVRSTGAGTHCGCLTAKPPVQPFR